jgi:hypothetical protein
MNEKNMTVTEILQENIRRLKRAGALPRGFDCGEPKPLVTDEMKNRVPFSRNYTTYTEYQEEVDRLFKNNMETTLLPLDIINKMADTANELGIF